MRFDVVLRNWATFFEREGIRWAVIGGLAMQAWGRSRFTKDVDIVVEARQKARVIREAEKRGYETIHVSSGFSNHHSTDETLGRVNFMYVDDETAATLFATATERPFIGDLVAPVPRPEYIAMMKCISMKNAPMRALFEGEDVRLLLNLPGVDVERVKEFSSGTACWRCLMRFEEHDDATLTFPELTPEDSATLAQVRDQYNVMDPHEYLAFLLQFSKSHPPTREIPPFHEPFKL